MRRMRKLAHNKEDPGTGTCRGLRRLAHSLADHLMQAPTLDCHHILLSTHMRQETELMTGMDMMPCLVLATLLRGGASGQRSRIGFYGPRSEGCMKAERQAW